MPPRIVDAVELPDAPPGDAEAGTAAAVVHALHPTRPAAAPTPKAPTNLAVVYYGIAQIIGARLMSLLLVGAMIVLSFMAVSDPVMLRLCAAAGFDLFALAGILILNGRA